MHPRGLTSPFVDPVFGLRAASVPQFRRSRGHCFQQQTSHPHEIEGRRSERVDPLYALDDAVAELSQEADALLPAEALLDELALLLAHRVATMTRRPSIDGTAPVRGVLRHVRRHATGAHTRHEGAGVVALVGSQRALTLSFGQSVQHRQGCLTFSRTRRMQKLGIDDEHISVFHQHVGLIGMNRPGFSGDLVS